MHIFLLALLASLVQASGWNLTQTDRHVDIEGFGNVTSGSLEVTWNQWGGDLYLTWFKSDNLLYGNLTESTQLKGFYQTEKEGELRITWNGQKIDFDIESYESKTVGAFNEDDNTTDTGVYWTDSDNTYLSWTKPVYDLNQSSEGAFDLIFSSKVCNFSMVFDQNSYGYDLFMNDSMHGLNQTWNMTEGDFNFRWNQTYANASLEWTNTTNSTEGNLTKFVNETDGGINLNVDLTRGSANITWDAVNGTNVTFNQTTYSVYDINWNTTDGWSPDGGFFWNTTDEWYGLYDVEILFEDFVDEFYDQYYNSFALQSAKASLEEMMMFRKMYELNKTEQNAKLYALSVTKAKLTLFDISQQME